MSFQNLWKRDNSGRNQQGQVPSCCLQEKRSTSYSSFMGCTLRKGGIGNQVFLAYLFTTGIQRNPGSSKKSGSQCFWFFQGARWPTAVRWKGSWSTLSQMLKELSLGMDLGPDFSFHLSFSWVTSYHIMIPSGCIQPFTSTLKAPSQVWFPFQLETEVNCCRNQYPANSPIMDSHAILFSHLCPPRGHRYAN